MTHNDEQIDLLIRRFAKPLSSAHGSQDHLDADELNAFAEDALPPAARARCVSHLADCNECRQQVAQLAIASGAVARTEAARKTVPRGFWAAISGVFTLPVMRYAGFAAILVVVAAVTFVALRRRSERTDLQAAREPQQEQLRAGKEPSADANPGLNDKTENVRPDSASRPPATSGSPLVAASSQNAKQNEDRVAENTTQPSQPVPMKEVMRSAGESEKKAEQLPVTQSQNAQSQQSYAPAPPAEAQARVQTQTGTVSVGGGLKTQSVQSADKAGSAGRERDAAKESRLDDATRAANQPLLAGRRATDEKMKGPSRNTDNVAANNRSTNEVRPEAAKRESEVVTRTEDAPTMRSVGGHKFRRQGNSWVDQKFKSSMALKNISRGSDDFAALDSGLRSIAQQISGEVIIVWKGKAYLIK